MFFLRIHTRASSVATIITCAACSVFHGCCGLAQHRQHGDWHGRSLKTLQSGLDCSELAGWRYTSGSCQIAHTGCPAGLGPFGKLLSFFSSCVRPRCFLFLQTRFPQQGGAAGSHDVRPPPPLPLPASVDLSQQNTNLIVHLLSHFMSPTRGTCHSIRNGLLRTQIPSFCYHCQRKPYSFERWLPPSMREDCPDAPRTATKLCLRKVRSGESQCLSFGRLCGAQA